MWENGGAYKSLFGGDEINVKLLMVIYYYYVSFCGAFTMRRKRNVQENGRVNRWLPFRFMISCKVYPQFSIELEWHLQHALAFISLFSTFHVFHKIFRDFILTQLKGEGVILCNINFLENKVIYASMTFADHSFHIDSKLYVIPPLNS